MTSTAMIRTSRAQTPVFRPEMNRTPPYAMNLNIL
jgi:hypothetical protein